MVLNSKYNENTFWLYLSDTLELNTLTDFICLNIVGKLQSKMFKQFCKMEL